MKFDTKQTEEKNMATIVSPRKQKFNPNPSMSVFYLYNIVKNRTIEWIDREIKVSWTLNGRTILGKLL